MFIEELLLLKNKYKFIPFVEPVELKVTFYTKIPESYSQLRKKHLENRWNMARADLDNYIKFFMDVGNGILYEDDACISSIIAEKRYSQDPRIEFSVEQLT